MDPLSNLTSIRGDVIELWDAATKKYVGIQELVLGIPPSSLDTLEKVASAIGNDPDYFDTIAAGLDSKADLEFTNSELADKADLVLTAIELETKATTSSVTDLTNRVVITESVVGVDESFNYLETGTEKLIIRGPDDSPALEILGSSSNELQGRAVFHSDILIEDGDLRIPTGNILLGRSNTAMNVATALSKLEPAFTAISPVKKVFSFITNEFQLKLDETAPLEASSFQTGKFRLSSPNDGSVRLQRFDDDGAFSTDGWRDVAMFGWDDTLLGSMLIDKIQSRTTSNVVFGDNALMEADAVVNGTLHAENSNLSVVWNVKDFFAGTSSGIGFHAADSTLALLVEGNGNPTAHQNLNVLGNITCSGSISGNTGPYWVAGVFDKEGNVFAQKGRFSFSVTKASGTQSAFDITFPAHPEGSNWTHSINSTEYHTFIRDMTSTFARVWLRRNDNADGWQGEGLTSFMILA